MILSSPFLTEFAFWKIDPSWFYFFFSCFQKAELVSNLKTVSIEYNNFSCWPSKENVFRLFQELSFSALKVVIIGQDPYYQPLIADGFAFSCQKENYLPASLRNIFLELKNDLGIDLVKNSLLGWVKQGVFLLNTSLSVRSGEPLSHLAFWKSFVFSLIKFLNQNKKLIWVFWGKEAQKIQKEHSFSAERVIFSSHPSPFSANFGFIGSRPFSRTNRLLSSLGLAPIDWANLD